MKINNQYTSYFDSYHSQVGHDNVEKETSPTMKKETVEVDLSKTSKKLRFNNQLEDTEKTNRIAEIKQTIKDGTYKVSAEEIADKMSDTLKGQKESYGDK